MIKYLNNLVTFSEYPDEISLCINLTLCPNGCIGCHSSYLAQDIGEELTFERLEALIDKNDGITLVGLMGGDNDPKTVQELLSEVKKKYNGGIKTGWYSGKEELPDDIDLSAFDYIKIGGYKQKMGGLDHRTTNQRMYKVKDGKLEDITYRFWK